MRSPGSNGLHKEALCRGTPYPTLTPSWRQHAGIRWRWYGESYVDKDWIMEVTGVLLLVFFQLGYSQSRNRKYVFLHHSSLKINIFSLDNFSVILYEDLSCAEFLRKQQQNYIYRTMFYFCFRLHWLILCKMYQQWLMCSKPSFYRDGIIKSYEACCI